MKGANSTEFDAKTAHPVISLLEEQQGVKAMGGTMRLGASRCRVEKATHAFRAYQRDEVDERHRHRYEVNNAYRSRLEQAGLVVAGTYQPGDLVEIIELKDHPWFVAGQFHPEFKSRPLEPHPLFRAFVEAALTYQQVPGRRQPATHRKPKSPTKPTRATRPSSRRKRRVAKT